MSKRNWHGVDVSNKYSLLEYGFLMKWIPKEKMYRVVFCVGYDCEGRPNTFQYTRWDAQKARKDLRENEKKLKEVADMCGLSIEEYWKNLSDAAFLYDLLAYNGVANNLWDYTRTYTLNEIKRKLNRALNKNSMK